MRFQRQITKIRCQEHIRKAKVTSLTGLGPVLETITRLRNSLFGNVASLTLGLTLSLTMALTLTPTLPSLQVTLTLSLTFGMVTLQTRREHGS